MKKIAIPLLLLCSLVSYAQKKKFYCTEFFSFNRDQLSYQTEVEVPRKYHTLELQFGVCLVKPLSKRFELRSRIGYGIKFKRDYDDRDPQLTSRDKRGQLLSLIYRTVDERLSAQNSDYLDIPIILHYNVPRSNWGIEVGFKYRMYSVVYPFINWRTFRGLLARDYGPLCNVTYSFNNLSVFCGYTLGLYKLMSGATEFLHPKYNPIHYTWSATTNLIQLGVEYKLFKKRNKIKIPFS